MGLFSFKSEKDDDGLMPPEIPRELVESEKRQREIYDFAQDLYRDMLYDDGFTGGRDRAKKHADMAFDYAVIFYEAMDLREKGIGY